MAFGSRSFKVLASAVFIAAGAVAADVPPDHAAQMARSRELFQAHVRSLLVEHCFTCHGGDAKEAGLDLSDRDRLLQGSKHGPVIVPGNASGSLLVQLLRHLKEPRMPQDAAPLPSAAVDRVVEWINLGAAYDAPLSATKSDSATWTDKKISANAKRFWAFQPIRRVAPPAGTAPTAIDAFIDAGLARCGLAGNPPAERRRLIRRMYFDLLGLPPDPQSVASFLDHPTPDAPLRLVDRLLADPRFGERWARHWLDAVRWGESHGFEHDYDRPTAYPYRDFVIQAFNADMPFDQFVRWQIAGDELAPDQPQALAATGFLAAGVHATQITKNEVEKHRYDELDDMLATIGTSMLGVTIGCARCHDHKFDPIPQADYYRMLATFTTTVRSEIEVDTSPQVYRQAKEAFDREHRPYVEALKRYESDTLPARFAEWERSGDPSRVRAPWTIPGRMEIKATGGATFTAQTDGSFAIQGPNPTLDTYTIQWTSATPAIRGIRIEALTDSSLVRGGPGRASNGNFALSNVTGIATPRRSGAASRPITFVRPRATFEQKGLPAAAAIDMDGTSAWAIDPKIGEPHALALDLDPPLSDPAGWVVQLTLSFSNNAGHGIGRPRIAISAESAAPVQGQAISETVRAALAKKPSERTSPDRLALLDWFRTVDPGWQALNWQSEQHARQAPKARLTKMLIASEGLPAIRLHTQGADFLPVTHFLRRGDPNQKERVATQDFLQVLRPESTAVSWQVPPPAGARTSHRRAALARWITDVDQGGGKLLARVIVNRLWHHHFGRGLVATCGDFGSRGEPPSHPELLDWLADELVRGGWRLKPIHRRILASRVYQQSSTMDPAKAALDPENRLIWRFTPRRLEAEAIRDSILAVSGMLDDTQFGPGTLNEATRRRGIYFTIKRSHLIPMLQVFDAPDALQGIPSRPTTTVAPQALWLMNHPTIHSASRQFALQLRRAGGARDAVGQAYTVAYSRSPTTPERRSAEQFLADQEASYRANQRSDAADQALADFCQVLFCGNEFLYIE